MKKIFCLLLCLVLVCTVLVSCGPDEIGDYIVNYPEKSEEIENVTLNLYIIAEEGTTANAKTTVQRMINQYTESEYHTTLNIHYLSSTEYNDAVVSAAADNGENGANIVLINSASLYNNLRDDGRLLDLTKYFSSRTYGRLNTLITKALLDGSKETGKSESDKKLYVVPNNRIIDEYEYLVIDKHVARDILHYSPAYLKSLTDPTSDAVEALKQEITNAGYNADSLVFTTSGMYEVMAGLESLGESGSYCNITKYPTVDSDIAYASAFAIINRDKLGDGDILDTTLSDRSMQIIYAINTDSYLRNLLQYGVSGTNYNVVDGDIVRVNDGENNYRMNILYTGDVFKAEYCSEIGWTPEVAAYGLLQNAESVVKAPAQKESE